MGKAKCNPDVFNPRVIGLSPLGNNSVEAQTSNIDVPVTDTTPREVPLVYEPITGTYSTPLDKINQEERLEGIEVANLTADDQRFLSAAGFVNGPVSNTPVGLPTVGKVLLDDSGHPMYDDAGNIMLDDSGSGVNSLAGS